MSSFPADGAMEAICLFKPWNGSVFPCGAVAEWLSSSPVFRRVSYVASTLPTPLDGFQLPFRAQTKDDAGDRGASDGSGEWGWEISLGHSRTRPPVPAVTTNRAVRIHRPDAFGTALLARWARPRMERSINDRHMPAMPSHARQRQNSSLRQSWSPICIRSDFCQSG